MTADERPPPARSVHGGALPFDEQAIRAEAFGKLFGATKTPLAIGRFEVVRTLGAGAMGTVYAARDDELDRMVAIKVLRPGLREEAAERQQRMAREARALAQLKHPNVVTVYEVGTFDDGLFIVMEFVEGQTLRRWCETTGRTREETVAMFIEAGRGLAAAHRRGIVHRDFKPDNVLVDDEEGRPRVADFGLARAGKDAPTLPSAPLSGDDSDGLTTRGAVGTPAYMPPEQLRGETANAASDQYSFCVSLHQALTGERPTIGKAPSSAALPRRIRAAIDRGLATAPSDRWPDMDALLARLAPRRTSRAWWLVAPLGIAVGAAIWLAPPDCDRSPPAVWTEARATVEKQITDAPVAYIRGTWPAVSSALDRYAARWRDESSLACRLASSRSDDDRARADECLQHRHDELAHLVQALAEGRQAALATAVTTTTTLPAPEPCNSAAGLASWRLMPDATSRQARDEARDELRDARETLAASRTAAGSTDFSELLARGEDAARRARSIAAEVDDVATASDALLVLGQIQALAGQATDAESSLHESARIAERAGDATARIRALTHLAYVVGQDGDRLREAEQIAEQARAALDATDDDPILRARLIGNLATVRARARPPQHDLAIAGHREAVGLLEDAAGRDHPDTIRARSNLGGTLTRAGRVDEAVPPLRTALADAAEVWGDAHPNYAKAARILGLALLRANELEEGRQHLARSLAIHERVFGPGHAEVANDLYNGALALRRQDLHAEALAMLRRGIVIKEGQHGLDHPELIQWTVLIGRSALELGHDDEAREALERAIRLSELDGAPAKDFAKIRVLLARALAEQEPARARVHAEQARDFYAGAPRFAQKLAAVEELLASLPE